MVTSRKLPVNRWPGLEESSGRPASTDSVALEVPVALTYNRTSHVVMMATPRDLEDFALGFSLTEGLLGEPSELLDVKVIPRPGGLEVAMTISPEWYERLAMQRRNMAGRTGCG